MHQKLSGAYKRYHKIHITTIYIYIHVLRGFMHPHIQIRNHTCMYNSVHPGSTGSPCFAMLHATAR